MPISESEAVLYPKEQIAFRFTERLEQDLKAPPHTIGGNLGVVFLDSDEGLTILTCDVSGHGVRSAVMANLMYSETVHALEHRMGPGTLLRQLHDFVQDRIAVDGFYS